jgi:hypothetical protein
MRSATLNSNQKRTAMHRPFGIVFLSTAAIFGLSAQTQASTPYGSRNGDHCSNEALEMTLKAIKTPGPPGPKSSKSIPIWDGLIEIRLKNVSSLMVRLVESANEYNISASDASGRDVPMTETGGKYLAEVSRPPAERTFVSASIFDLQPAQEFKIQMYISHFFKIEPGQAYTIRLGRASGLPKVNQVGTPIKHPDLNCSLTIPAGALVESQ